MEHVGEPGTAEYAAETMRKVTERIESAVVIERETLTVLLAAVLSRGHVLLEDVPGTGKTVAAHIASEALGLEFSRIQFTPDLLPSDVTGSTIYNEHDGSFEFAPGPVFGNLILADEINRAPPKTQAALLEAMEERQVTVDGETYDLPSPFVVLATQNPIEQEGTFRLPEAQRDRFNAKLSMGYPDAEGEMELLDRRADRDSHTPSVEPVIDAETLRGLQLQTEEVTVNPRVRRYLIDIARETRNYERVAVGVSPGIQRVFECARALALIEGRMYTTPDEIKRLAVPTMAHRIVLETEAAVEGLDAATVVTDAVEAVPVPAVSETESAPELDDLGPDEER